MHDMGPSCRIVQFLNLVTPKIKVGDAKSAAGLCFRRSEGQSLDTY